MELVVKARGRSLGTESTLTAAHQGGEAIDFWNFTLSPFTAFDRLRPNDSSSLVTAKDESTKGTTEAVMLS